MITSMNHITLAVKDLEKSFAFYRDILGFKPLVKSDGGAYFLVGQQAQSFWCSGLCNSQSENLL
jgi:catechol 2,3-dioxygenase-like lactoylglutathione lyase family enzyme